MKINGPHWLFLIAFVVSPWVCLPAARAGDVYLNGLAVGAGSMKVSVQSFQGRKFSTTVKQEYDFSCGSAALATLLTFSYHQPTS